MHKNMTILNMFYSDEFRNGTFLQEMVLTVHYWENYDIMKPYK